MDMKSKFRILCGSIKAWIRVNIVDTTAPIPAKPDEVTNVLRKALFPQNDNNELHQQLVHWVESGGNLDWRTPNGWTLLHLAAQCGNEKMIRFLIERGSDIEARDNEGLTPLMLACETGYTSLRLNPSVVKTLLELGANPNSEDFEGRRASSLVRLLASPAAEKITALLEQHGAQKVPGKTATCPECGAPESVHMKDRGVQVTLHGVFAGFSCPHCKKEEQVPLDAIDKAWGLQVSCPSCHRDVFVPPTVWCKTCGIGLSTGWQTLLISGTSAEIGAAVWRYHPIATQYRQMARELISKYGPLKRVEYLSHFPGFEINFVFENKTVYSGKRSGQYDIHFLSLGYVGEGPRYAREFLAEAGFSMSSDDIEAIKPGAIIQLRKGTVFVEYPPKTADTVGP